ncbi:MAG TPA: calcium/sodium antiporter [Longimicrobiales bacterium]|nr:calcium/sodium antiporter [Longimicrobiales bacterium]
MTVLLFIAGIVVLVAGGELLVRGAARLAAATGISPLVVGLTVVAFGTSSPELAVSVQASLAGEVDIAVGNVVGSNIFNVLLILGFSAAIVPLVVSAQLVRLDVPIMIGISGLLLLLSLDGLLSRAECMLLAGGLVAYIGLQIVLSRRSPYETEEEPVDTGRPLINILLILAGLALLVLGSRWLVQAAVQIAEAFGVTPLVIGLTIVAAGTSMPELATSVVAGVRGQRDIAVGNIIGSNIFNILAVLGISGAVSPTGIPVSNAALTLDLPVMVAVAVLCVPIFRKHAITRWEGLLFVAYYVIYAGYLVLDSANHEGLAEYRTLVLTTVLPLTLMTVLVFSFRRGRPGHG